MEPCLLDIMDHVLLYLSVPEAVRVASSNSLFFDKLQCNKMFWESLDFSSNSMSNGVDVALRMMKSSISRKGALIPCLNFAFCKLMNDSYLEELFHILSKQHPEKFKQLIKTINLNGCHAVTNTGLLAVARSCNSVQNLQLYCNVHITDTGVVPLIKSNGRSLVVLNLSGCRSVGDASMKALAVSCASSLTSLNLTRTSSVTDVGVMLLCGALPHLRELILYACNHLPSRTFRHLSCFNQLEHLDLCGCSVSDSDIKDIFSHCPKLEKLNLTWCTKLTDEALIHMANAGCNNLSPHMTSAVGLRVLSLHGLKAITPIGLEALISSCHRFTLTEVDVRGCILLHSSYLSDNFKGLRVAFPNVTNFELHN